MATDPSPARRTRLLTWTLLIAGISAVIATPAAMALRVLSDSTAPPSLSGKPASSLLAQMPTAAPPQENTPDAATATTADAPAGLPRSAPVRLSIPAIKLSAPITTVGVDGDGVVQVPPLNRPQQAGWYKHGPTPGELGPAVILGHVDTTTGPAVFARLGELKTGDAITVTRKDGSKATFTVTSISKVAKKNFPTRRVYGPLDYAGLRLITCDGDFDTRTRSYTDNMIVYARLK